MQGMRSFKVLIDVAVIELNEMIKITRARIIQRIFGGSGLRHCKYPVTTRTTS